MDIDFKPFRLAVMNLNLMNIANSLKDDMLIDRSISPSYFFKDIDSTKCSGLIKENEVIISCTNDLKPGRFVTSYYYQHYPMNLNTPYLSNKKLNSHVNTSTIIFNYDTMY
ncbi:hypothetical protein RF11_06624 [Thelohanellus kitauei]|uniref:Uncharacterized protein n=1 Tax=Thelohanellus kitauei TaxID=669202 RepID=A0A0C2NL08_THEKT|nr:hypothetical protein RF11_06624 [Thelohanellus kitauei]